MITLNEQDAGLVRDGKKWQLRLPIHPQPLHIASVDLFGNATGESVIWDPAGSSPISQEELTSLCPHAQAGQRFVAQVSLPYQKQESLGLLCKSIRVERLEAISDRDLLAEGGRNWTVFASNWGDLHGRAGYPVVANPSVWVIEFALA